MGLEKDGGWQPQVGGGEHLSLEYKASLYDASVRHWVEFPLCCRTTGLCRP